MIEWTFYRSQCVLYTMYGFVSFTMEVCVRSSMVFCIETIWSDVSLYRIDFTFVTNLLRFVSKRLVSKRLCIETTVNPNYDIWVFYLPLWLQIACSFMEWNPLRLTKSFLFSCGAWILMWVPSTQPITPGNPPLVKKPRLFWSISSSVDGHLMKFLCFCARASETWPIIRDTDDFDRPRVSPITWRKLPEAKKRNATRTCTVVDKAWFVFRDRREGATLSYRLSTKTVSTSQFFISKVGQGKVVW